MAKDPAVLFYTSDFLTGTMTMNNEQVGKYIRLLCLQHQKGVLSEKDMLFICGSYDADIFSKFKKNGIGFYNERLREEAEKRASYSASRALNRSKNKKKFKKHMKDTSKTYDAHMENENVNENINISNININKGKFKKPTLEEVALYCLERKNKIDPQTFIDHYTSNGWRVGKNPMSDWKAAVRTWEKNNFEGSNKNGTGKRSYQQNTGRELPPDIAESVDATTREWLEKKRLAAANQDGKNTR